MRTFRNTPRRSRDSRFSARAIADIIGDGNPDILLGTDSAALLGFDGTTCAAAAGWPQWTGGWSLATAAVGDLRGAGTVDVAVTTREGYLHIYSTPRLTCANHEAWHWHQNDRNTGHYGDDTRRLRQSTICRFHSAARPKND